MNVDELKEEMDIEDEMNEEEEDSDISIEIEGEGVWGTYLGDSNAGKGEAAELSTGGG